MSVTARKLKPDTPNESVPVPVPSDQGESGEIWEPWLEEAIATLWQKIQDHPDECGCRDCLELEILAFK